MSASRRNLLKRKSDGKDKSKPAKRIKKSEKSEDELGDTDNEVLDIKYNWEIEDVIAGELILERNVVHNVIKLLDQENTIPFIARYRKEKTNNIEVKKLYELKESYENLTFVKNKVQKLGQTIKKAGKMTANLMNALSRAKTLDDVEQLAAPFKTASKKTLAERARQLGLENAALQILEGIKYDLVTCIKPGTKGLENLDDVKSGIQHIIADIISKDQDLLQNIQKYLQESAVKIESIKSKAATKEEIDATRESIKNCHRVNHKLKFENYYKFNLPIRVVKPHQVLAMNRGENLKMLVIKIVIPQTVYDRFAKLCDNKWVRRQTNSEHSKLLTTSYNDAWNRLLEPQFCRQIRSNLTKISEKASIDVFASNIRQLLLTPPVRGMVVMGIDPGFKNGCKVAVISPTQDILQTTVFHLPGKHVNNKTVCKKISDTLHQYSCTTIGIGNGTASRETESLISEMISRGDCQPLDVKYCIVNENGASIYSVTEDAAKEMPNLDPNLRSAVSIARRLQDPLAEYVKIEPKHLGVGMYQHDVAQTKLRTALDDVVTECVSFVGVDLNTGSEALLRKVAGLNSTRAKNIVDWRSLNGPFSNREQVKLVKGIGPKSFEQCAGFIRILVNHLRENKPNLDEIKKPSGSSKQAKTRGKSAKTQVNYLDMTCIHPESYNIANSFLKFIDEPLENIGNCSVMDKVKKLIESNALQKVADDLKCGLPTLQLIADGLSHPLNYDMRSEFQTPLFRKGLSSINDLKVGTNLTGRVTNVVHFGAFVDVGIGHDGLIHTSSMKGSILHVGDRVEVVVKNIDVDKKRVGLIFSRLL